VLPLYPQYAGSTTATAFDAIADWARTVRNQPELRFVRSYHDHPSYIAALAARVRETWGREGRLPGTRLVLSFHGVPKRTLMLGDPYHCECLKTGRLLTEALRLEPGEAVISFQSRFGRDKWLQPYTQQTLERLGKEGVKRVDVACPGFAADCLETLEEIAMECKAAFLSAGGKEYHYIPALNDRADWIQAMCAIVLENLQGWLECPSGEAADERRARAVAMGASA